ncbi:hypothetical protein SESBI_23140 [Sesbania bispinosa]|nr:hypothetical protein SESBI_23140 [Sesbania bispinosa]
MSSSSSKHTSTPPITPQLQLESTLNIPPDPGNSFHNPLTDSSVSNNNPISNYPQNQNAIANQTPITFSHILQYYWRGIIHDPTPSQRWLAQNVYPLVTPMRMICFFVSQISFMLACGFFMETELYKTHVSASGGHHHVHVHAPDPLVFSVLVAMHVVFLILLLFFSFFTAAYERYLHPDLLKSLGELVVMEVMSLLISGIEHKHQDQGTPEIAALLATCAFLTVDALCIIILLKPGHHYSLLDATLTLTLHLALEGQGIYAIPAALFVFVILAIKNFLWRRIGHGQGSNNQRLRLVWFASDEVVDNLSSA